MYSKNDYRYYLEDQLIHSDDFLAHYGVKGMKWKKHKTGGLNDIFDLMGQNSRKLLSDPKSAAKDTRNVLNGTRKRSLELAREDNIRGVKKTEHAMNEKRNRSLNGYSERKTKTAPNMSTTRKNKGLKAKIDNYRKKHNIKSSVFNKNVWKREVPKGKKLKGSKNIYVSHE